MFKALIQISIIVIISFGLFVYFKEQKLEAKKVEIQRLEEVAKADKLKQELAERERLLSIKVAEEKKNGKSDLAENQAEIRAKYISINKEAVSYYKSIISLLRKMPAADTEVTSSDLRGRIKDAKVKYKRAIELKRILPQKYHLKGELALTQVKTAYSRIKSKDKTSSQKSFLKEVSNWNSKRRIEYPATKTNFSNSYKYLVEYQYRDGKFYHHTK